MGDDPTPYVIIGMMCCFGSIARAPLAVMLMVAEMTGSIGSIEPGIIAVGLAWLIVSRGEETMYRSQLISRASHDPPPDPGITASTRHEPSAPF
jgi:chloride channel protein, CIC family